MNCEYCETYCLSTIRLAGERYCSIIRKTVPPTAAKCEKFKAYPFFWCKKNEQQFDLPICSARQKRGEELCRKCKSQRETVNYVMRLQRKAAAENENGVGTQRRHSRLDANLGL